MKELGITAPPPAALPCTLLDIYSAQLKAWRSAVTVPVSGEEPTEEPAHMQIIGTKKKGRKLSMQEVKLFFLFVIL